MKNRSSHAVSLLTLLLALLMLSASAVSCADTGTGSDDTSAQATAALTEAPETSSIYDTDGYLLDKLPEKMSLGTDIALLYWSDVENPEFEITEQGGEIVEDALYTRDVRVKERLGTDIVYSSTPGNNNNNAAFTTYVQNAVKGGETVPMEELSWLIGQIMNGDMPPTCPHGRPLMVTLSHTDLDRRFRRIQQNK